MHGRSSSGSISIFLRSFNIMVCHRSHKSLGNVFRPRYGRAYDHGIRAAPHDLFQLSRFPYTAFRDQPRSFQRGRKFPQKVVIGHGNAFGFFGVRPQRGSHKVKPQPLGLDRVLQRVYIRHQIRARIFPCVRHEFFKRFPVRAGTGGRVHGNHVRAAR